MMLNGDDDVLFWVVFIRAFVITSCGFDVEVFAKYAFLEVKK